MTEYVGIDGCPAGWIAVFINEYGVLNVEVKKNLEGFSFDRQNPNDIILIDMPLGLENRPDGELRKTMKKNKSSVFTIDFTKKLSKQTEAIKPKIYEANKFIGGFNPIFHFWESHPEFCFELLNNRKGLFPKKTGAGQAERLLILKISVSPKLKNFCRKPQNKEKTSFSNLMICLMPPV